MSKKHAEDRRDRRRAHYRSIRAAENLARLILECRSAKMEYINNPQIPWIIRKFCRKHRLLVSTLIKNDDFIGALPLYLNILALDRRNSEADKKEINIILKKNLSDNYNKCCLSIIENRNGSWSIDRLCLNKLLKRRAALFDTEKEHS
jgi:hypothetical protein